MNKHIIAYVAQCLNCQHVKYDNWRPGGLFQRIERPEYKWEQISMDFVTGVPKTRKKFDAVMVIFDRLTKSVYLILVAVSYPRGYLKSIFERLFVIMVCRYLSFRIEVRSLPHILLV